MFDPAPQVVTAPRVVSEPLAVALLQKARERIADPTSWCRGAYRQLGTNWWGQPVERFCAVGALRAASGRAENQSFRGTELDAVWALICAAQTLFGVEHCPESVNDSWGHAAVLHMYDYAIGAVRTGSVAKRVSA